MPTPHRLFVLATVLCLAVALPSCGDDDDDEAASKPDAKAEVEVEKAYLAYWDMGERLLETPNPKDPEIPRRTTGKAREDLIAGLQRLKDEGLRYDLGPHNSEAVLRVTVTGETATAKVCVVDDAKVVENATGAVRASGTTTAPWTISLRKDSGTWKVSAANEGQPREGVGGCD